MKKISKIIIIVAIVLVTVGVIGFQIKNKLGKKLPQNNSIQVKVENQENPEEALLKSLTAPEGNDVLDKMTPEERAKFKASITAPKGKETPIDPEILSSITKK